MPRVRCTIWFALVIGLALFSTDLTAVRAQGTAATPAASAVPSEPAVRESVVRQAVLQIDTRVMIKGTTGSIRPDAATNTVVYTLTDKLGDGILVRSSHGVPNLSETYDVVGILKRSSTTGTPEMIEETRYKPVTPMGSPEPSFVRGESREEAGPSVAADYHSTTGRAFPPNLPFYIAGAFLIALAIILGPVRAVRSSRDRQRRWEAEQRRISEECAPAVLAVHQASPPAAGCTVLADPAAGATGVSEVGPGGFANHRRCPTCMSPVLYDATFCDSCGAPLTAAPTGPQPDCTMAYRVPTAFACTRSSTSWWAGLLSLPWRRRQPRPLAADRDADLYRLAGPVAEDYTVCMAGAAMTLDSELTPQCPLPPAASVQDRGMYDLGRDYRLEPVDCTVFAPPHGHPGQTIMVQVWAHQPEEAPAAEVAAREADEEAHWRGATSLGTYLAAGAELAFELTMRELRVHNPVKQLTWTGRGPQAVQFEVEIPRDASLGAIAGTLLVLQDSVPIGEVVFKVTIAATVPDTEAAPEPSGEARRYRVAFISYASADRPTVLPRVQMLSAAGIKYFMDVVNLEPGAAWGAEIEQHIDESDVMFLFWSTAAKASSWVEKEWRYALTRKPQEGYIRPVPIEGPPPIPPPPELAHLHFNDPVLYFMHA